MLVKNELVELLVKRKIGMKWIIKADGAKQRDKRERKKRDREQFSGQIVCRQYNFNQSFDFTLSPLNI